MFFIFAAILIAAAAMVITLRNSVYAALFLALTFFTSAILWMMMQAEFLALVLIFIYVGAIMTLFLFVVMMLNINLAKMQEKFVRFLPFSLIVILLFITTMVVVISLRHFRNVATSSLPFIPANVSNVRDMGNLLYANYFYPVEIAAIILLVAIISVISLAFYGRRPDTKSQRVPEQLKVKKLNRLRIVKIEVKRR